VFLNKQTASEFSNPHHYQAVWAHTTAVSLNSAPCSFSWPRNYQNFSHLPYSLWWSINWEITFLQ